MKGLYEKVFDAIVVVSGNGREYRELTENPLREFCFVYQQDEINSFLKKIIWIRNNYNFLVEYINSNHPSIGSLTQSMMFVYQDTRVSRFSDLNMPQNASWVLHCIHQNWRSQFIFRYFPEGYPEKIEEDTMLDVVHRFYLDYPPYDDSNADSTQNRVGLTQDNGKYRLIIDFEKVKQLSPFPVKIHS